MPSAYRSQSPLLAVPAPPGPLRAPSRLRRAAICLSVGSRASGHMRTITAGAGRRLTKAGCGRGTASGLQAWGCQRTSMRIVFANLGHITSCMSKRTTRLRSAWVVVPACQTAGSSCPTSRRPCRSAALTWWAATGASAGRVSLELLQDRQLLMPVPLETPGHQAGFGFPFLRAPSGLLGLVAGARQPQVPLVIHGARLGCQLRARLQGTGALRRFDRRSEPRGHCRGNPLAADARAGCARKRVVEPRTDIPRAAAIGPIPHRHATAADATPHDAWQEGTTFAPRASPLLGIDRALIVELLLMATKLGPAEIAGGRRFQERWPLVTLDLARGALHARGCARQRPLPRLGAPIDVGPRREGMVQEGQHPRVPQRAPDHRACALAVPPPLGNLHAMFRTMLHHGHGGLCGGKPRNHLTHRVLDCFIGLAPNLPRCLRDYPHWKPPSPRTARRFFARAPDQPAGQPGQCCFTHGAAEAEEQPIMVLPRIIDPIFVDHQGVGHGTDLQQTIPGAAGAGQARRFSPAHGSRPPQADFGDARRTAIATGARGSGMALVLVNDDDQMLRPSPGVGALSALILAGRTGRVVADLHEG
jgi:hypothetical protein